MKLYIYVLFFFIVLMSCKTKQRVLKKNNYLEILSANVIAFKHLKTKFSHKTIDAKINAVIKYKTINKNISLKLKIEKDKTIWIKGSYLITLFKLKLTPSKVYYYSPYMKNYYEGDFSILKKIFGVKINFNQFQNILLGQSLINLTTEKQEIVLLDKLYKLYPKKQPNLFDLFFYINPTNFKLTKQSVVDSVKNKRLDIVYPSYYTKDKEFFPKKIVINIKENKKNTNIDMIVKSVEFNTKHAMHFKIPKGYKKIKL